MRWKTRLNFQRHNFDDNYEVNVSVYEDVWNGKEVKTKSISRTLTRLSRLRRERPGQYHSLSDLVWVVNKVVKVKDSVYYSM